MSTTSFPYPWVPDQGDGTYRNPVLHADYSDPDAIRVGEDYYLVASSFNCTPGLPILHSRDLVNWRLVNHALQRLPDPRYAEVQHGQGVWAPAIREHGGRYWICFPTPDEGLYMTTADHPEGEWSEPWLLLGGKGLIDPCPFWDDDGKAYLAHAYAGSRAGIRNILRIRPMSPDGREVLGEGRVVAQIDPQLPALEGPKMHKRNGWYYISAPSGGVPIGWQVIFRSRDIHGPYEEKIVIAQRGTATNGPHQGALVDTPDGEWWFLHFQEKQPYGRIVHLQPVRWEDDWPLIGIDQDAEGVGKPVECFRKPVAGVSTPCIPQDSDEFDAPTLGLQWQWHANPAGRRHSLSARPGHLRLYPGADGELRTRPNLLLQKFPAGEFSAATRVELAGETPGLRAGLVVMGEVPAALEVTLRDGGCRVRLLVGAEPQGELLLDERDPLLRVAVAEGGSCRFGVVTDAGFHQIGPAHQALPGMWIGAKVGLFCLAEEGTEDTGHADFAWFRIAPLRELPEAAARTAETHVGGPFRGKEVPRPAFRAPAARQTPTSP